ncbi:MAG: recombination mediator RecR [Methylomonas sp.]|nr:recombination mediator RecR [Methylomonas sp.]PPD20968.1 MAG: recombination protein RecR [Methylomonas sp.]PPD27213.1 MAG: recombination protein RecR [Methylomonas sp.]PPD39163.1 MAG: recombination protein RecR [Methylomonas sp.]PPD41322.1 MAG: recombination protein RecR [Methylomonas sp.]
MQNPGLLKELIQSLTCLPGVGAKSAQRMAFYLLQRNREGGRHLASILERAMAQIHHCRDCRTLTEHEVCEVCSDPLRDDGVLCVVETAADAWLLDQATRFRGKYFVLHGRLSPLDGIGPDQLGIAQLERRLAAGQVKEIILATNATLEGQATAHFIAEIASRHAVLSTRIAHGVPMGGELEFIDSSTLAHAFNGRQAF